METEKIKLTTRQILLYLVDGLVAFHKPFDRHGMYRKSIQDYFDWRDIDKKRFNDDLKRLEREGVLRIYLEDNQGLIELSNKGKEKVRLILAKEYKFKYPPKWDFKWRIVIFDIPELKKRSRDSFRGKLQEIGFYQLQESVFVFPFDCKEVIDYFVAIYSLKRYVQYVIAETIETQTNLIHWFLKKGILKKSMFSSKRNLKVES